jgi:two-component system NtrC family sensor kinase
VLRQDGAKEGVKVGFPEKDRYTGMRRMIFFCMILVPVIPFIAVLGIGYYHFTTSLETSTLATMNRIVEDHRQMIDTFLRERRGDLGFIINTNSYEDLTDPEKVYKVFTQLQRYSNAFVDLGVFDQEGIHVMYQGPYRLVGIDYGKEEWFRHTLKEGYYISDIFLGFRRIPHFVVALKREESGKTWVINELVEKVRIGKTGEAYILNAQGIFQTARRSGGNLLAKDPDDIHETKPEPGVRTFIRKDAKGAECLFATTWLQEKEWMLVVRQETADAFKALRSATSLILFIMILGGVTITVLAYTLTRQIIRRMQRIDEEKHQLGQQLVRATRLAELGQMAAGFAHEINNPLQIMKSDRALIEMIFSDLKKKGDLKEPDVKDLEETLDQLKLQIERCSKITQTILEFGRKSEPTENDVDLGAFISQVTSMITKKASVQGIRLKKEISEQTPLLRSDPSQLQQVLLNLLNNAIDAITERHGCEGGELSIQAGPDTNGRVKLSVRDNGAGISPDNLKKIFAPFFTTKPPGKGTGLGLYVCYGIIEGMGGTMEVESQRGVGTTFVVRLPSSSARQTQCDLEESATEVIGH